LQSPSALPPWQARSPSSHLAALICLAWEPRRAPAPPLSSPSSALRACFATCLQSTRTFSIHHCPAKSIILSAHQSSLSFCSSAQSSRCLPGLLPDRLLLDTRWLLWWGARHHSGCCPELHTLLLAGCCNSLQAYWQACCTSLTGRAEGHHHVQSHRGSSRWICFRGCER
jgi:hypothetical protein